MICSNNIPFNSAMKFLHWASVDTKTGIPLPTTPILGLKSCFKMPWLLEFYFWQESLRALQLYFTNRARMLPVSQETQKPGIQ